MTDNTNKAELFQQAAKNIHYTREDGRSAILLAHRYIEEFAHHFEKQVMNVVHENGHRDLRPVTGRPVFERSIDGSSTTFSLYPLKWEDEHQTAPSYVKLRISTTPDLSQKIDIAVHDRTAQKEALEKQENADWLKFGNTEWRNITSVSLDDSDLKQTMAVMLTADAVMKGITDIRSTYKAARSAERTGQQNALSP
jgi:hypothetical protein